MDWIRDHLWESWLVLAGVLAAAELLSLDLVLLMLACGAVVASVSAAAGAGIWVSTIIGLTVALAMLFLVRPPIVARLHSGPDLLTGSKALAGKRASVLVPIAPDAPGRIKIGGEDWLALPADAAASYVSGAIVEIVRIEGTTAYVQNAPAVGA